MTDTTQTAASDIPRDGWVDRLLPHAARPFARLSRLDRPIGTWLLLFPCWWSIALGRPDLAEGVRLFVLFALGAVVMRGAGCTYNDIVDRDFDRAVARTADRPIPSGAVSVRGALAWLFVQLLVGLTILVQLNSFAIGMGVASLVLVFTYPLMKRVTWWPQFFLGLAFNWGALMGYAAVAGRLDAAPVLLYIAGIFWTLGYDTIYAHQDKEDDALIGVKSSALRLGPRTVPALWAFYAATVALLAAVGWQAGLGHAYIALLVAGAVQLGWQVRTLGVNDPVDCLAKFKSNRLFGWLLLAGILFGPP
ncbi:MAG: 4-hydroxybenzoate octaprenyltransferase [Alphaproteobacteria bacterium]|nr:4-hydroxybenzoate octaprenyltransferase [Alphaproteobacteria bacterium]